MNFYKLVVFFGIILTLIFTILFFKRKDLTLENTLISLVYFLIVGIVIANARAFSNSILHYGTMFGFLIANGIGIIVLFLLKNKSADNE